MSVSGRGVVDLAVSGCGSNSDDDAADAGGTFGGLAGLGGFDCG